MASSVTSLALYLVLVFFFSTSKLPFVLFKYLHEEEPQEVE